MKQFAQDVKSLLVLIFPGVIFLGMWEDHFPTLLQLDGLVTKKGQ